MALRRTGADQVARAARALPGTLAPGRGHAAGRPTPPSISTGIISGTLGQVLRGTVPGRLTDADVTIYTTVGLPWQDLALAWAAYQQARAAGRGREADLLA